MFTEPLTRKVLGLTIIYNLFGALMFMFPGTMGALADFPTPAPFLYSWSLAGVILLLGAVAAWLSRRDPIDLPLLTVFGISKVAFFFLMLTSYLLGEVNMLGVLGAGADLVMGIIFLGYVVQASRR